MFENLHIIVEDKSMCMGKVIVCCPVCKSPMQVTRPDSGHPFWSTDKPEKDEGVDSVVEQVLQCKNPACAAKFSIYWYDK
jgi:uncharacterized protein YbaR (Trm112 family)